MLEDLALQPLDTGTALSLWERADDLSQPRRALALLAAASARTEEELARMPLGRRDAALLRVHALTFGAALECVATCAGCGAELELELELDALLATSADAPARPATEVVIGGERRALRAVTTEDLERALASADPRACLAARCAGCDPADLHGELLDEIEELLAELDPLADVRIALACDGCGAQTALPFDAGGTLWLSLIHI